MKTTFATIAALALVTACAQSPDAIAPVSMGGVFDALPCAQARAMLASDTQTLAVLDAQQRSAMAGDAIGVFLIGIPTSSLTGGDVAGQIGATKGKVLALQARVSVCGS